jgi:hypothetical protein
MRPSCTMQSSSASDETASMTSLVGASRSCRASIGSASILPARPNAQAAATATGLWRSSSRSSNSGTTSACGLAHRQAAARTDASLWRSSGSDAAGGRRHPRCTAAWTASCRAGPCTTLSTMMRDTAAAASDVLIVARPCSAAICSGTACSRPKPLKRRHSASSAGTAAANLRRAASTHNAWQSANRALGRAATNDRSSRLLGTREDKSMGVASLSDA